MPWLLEQDNPLLDVLRPVTRKGAAVMRYRSGWERTFAEQRPERPDVEPTVVRAVLSFPADDLGRPVEAAHV